MWLFLWSASTGWIATSFLAAASALPFALRWLRVRGMRAHYVLGFAIPALALIHSSFTMTRMRGTDQLGIWLATLALVGLFVQMSLGIELRAPPWGRPRRLRRWHLAMMIATSGLVAGHIALNRA
jgi:phosphatidylserine synthase